MAGPSERLAWAVKTLDVQPGERLLEVGCGHGVAVALALQALGPAGRITAVDRSPKMIEMAERRNASDADRTRFVTGAIESADLGDESYDKAFAIHVAALHRPGPALDAVRGRLVPGGRLYLFSQAPGWRSPRQAERFAEELAGILQAAGLRAVLTLAEPTGGAFSAGVIAERP